MKLNERIAAIPLPVRMRKLPISAEGFPVPWFAAVRDGKADLRIADTSKIEIAVKARLCWICGDKLSRKMAFVSGPMCLLNRIASEPPSHPGCAEYAAKACPFLAEPRMRRNRKDGLPDGVADVNAKRNPGVAVLWMTTTYKSFTMHEGLVFDIGPGVMRFFCEGREATRDEVMRSIDEGLPLLRERLEPAALATLDQQYREALQLVPA